MFMLSVGLIIELLATNVMLPASTGDLPMGRNVQILIQSTFPSQHITSNYNYVNSSRPDDVLHYVYDTDMTK